MFVIFRSTVASFRLSHFSDVAEFVFNKCTTLKDDAPDSPEFTVDLNYEFLEDIYAEWIKTKDNGLSTSSDVRPCEDSDSQSLSSNESAEYESVVNSKTEKEKLRDLEMKENHPLMLMVRCLFLGCPVASFTCKIWC